LAGAHGVKDLSDATVFFEENDVCSLTIDHFGKSIEFREVLV
jgi:hypothetical protein